MPLIEPLPLEGLKLITLPKYEDERGYFYESFNQDLWRQLGIESNFVQDNQSYSKYGVIRGLHGQHEPYAQGKLVRVLQGEIYDVCVDLRPSSKTLGHWLGIHLSASLPQQLWIPAGFAHGFATISQEGATVAYKVTQAWQAQSEFCIAFDDSDLSIKWPTLDVLPIVSQRDRSKSLSWQQWLQLKV